MDPVRPDSAQPVLIPSYKWLQKGEEQSLGPSLDTYSTTLATKNIGNALSGVKCPNRLM